MTGQAVTKAFEDMSLVSKYTSQNTKKPRDKSGTSSIVFFKFDQ